MRLLIGCAVLLAVPALAVPALAAPTAVRLSPAQIEAAQRSGEQRNRAAEALALLPDADARPDRKIHGEVGVAVGSGGYNSLYGTVETPLGENGSAAFSFERSDYGRNYRRGYYTGGSFGFTRR